MNFGKLFVITTFLEQLSHISERMQLQMLKLLPSATTCCTFYEKMLYTALLKPVSISFYDPIKIFIRRVNDPPSQVLGFNVDLLTRADIGLLT